MLGVKRGEGLILLLVHTLSASGCLADVSVIAFIFALDVRQTLAKFLDVPQARLLELPLRTEVLLLLAEPVHLLLDLGQTLAGVLLVLTPEHPLGQFELQEPSLDHVDLGRDRLELHRDPAGGLVDGSRRCSAILRAPAPA